MEMLCFQSQYFQRKNWVNDNWIELSNSWSIPDPCSCLIKWWCHMIRGNFKKRTQYYYRAKLLTIISSILIIWITSPFKKSIMLDQNASLYHLIGAKIHSWNNVNFNIFLNIHRRRKAWKMYFLTRGKNIKTSDSPKTCWCCFH